ncbi:MAG: universal stress protein [Campylobacteraceae bacterium]|nr:universal stress protein [Campylobacteraceae bacterium]
MNYKKMFFPVGGGDELEERLYGALLITKFFDIKLEILKCSFPQSKKYKELGLSQHIVEEIEEDVGVKLSDEDKDFKELLEKVAKQLEFNFPFNNSQIDLIIKEGVRSKLIEEDSKYCDLVIAAAPPQGVTTATFETALLKSGKPVLMFPRVLKKFRLDSVIIGWNGSPEASRAITLSIDMLKKAQRVHIVSSEEYTKSDEKMNKLIDYLKEHDVDATYKIVETTRIPGEALLTNALDGNFDLIVAGAFGQKGLKELMFGGATKYLLEHSPIPVFMSH